MSASCPSYCMLVQRVRMYSNVCNIFYFCDQFLMSWRWRWIKIALFWVLTLRSLGEMCWSSRGSCHLCHHGRLMKQQESLKFTAVSHPRKQPYLWVFRSSGMWCCVDTVGRSWHLWTAKDEDSTFIQSPSSSSYVCHGVGPLVDPFRSHVSRSLFEGLPWFLLPVGKYCLIKLGNLLRGILFTWCIQFPLT